MSGLIPIDELTQLKAASAVKSVAEEAVHIIEEQTVAAAINGAANTGATSITWSKTLSDEMITELKAQGYKVIKNGHAADPNFSWTIKF